MHVFDEEALKSSEFLTIPARFQKQRSTQYQKNSPQPIESKCIKEINKAQARELL